MDSRIIDLADMLVHSALSIQKNENVLIETTDTPDALSVALVRAVARAGARPFLTQNRSAVHRALLQNASDEQMKIAAEHDLNFMKQMQVYLSIRGSENSLECSDVPSDRQLASRLIRQPALDYRVNKTRWCVLRWPTPSMAQSAGMSTEAFEDFFFQACLADYPAMRVAAQGLIDLLNRTDKVRLVAPGTDLSFSIRGIPAVPCCGTMNIPDGEVYTAPVKNSVNGVIAYNAPTLYQGKRFENVRLVFKDGKIVEATSSDTPAMNAIFDTDEGARYVGEFAFGFNPFVRHPIGDILFDEKISGSIHFTPGMCYEDAPNGNKSAVHWDLVLIMTPEYGGGEIYLDGKLVRKDGRFVLPELEALNPENLSKNS